VRRRTSNSKQNQNQSGAVEPIVSVAVNEYQKKTKRHPCTLVVRNPKDLNSCVLLL
jgi:hypothetical protein